MKFSIAFLPEFPIDYALNIVRRADELGFDTFWGADEIYYKDPWQLFALGSRITKSIKFGPCLAHIYMQDPTMIGRSLATLDETSNGRAVCTLVIGDLMMLEQYGLK